MYSTEKVRFRMPKQRSSASPNEAGPKRIHLTEQYCLQSGEITSDLFLKHGTS